MVSRKTKIAKAGEELAANFLEKKGYKILHKNWRYSNFGEIDIIAEHNKQVIFVEVKTRSSKVCGDPVESINTSKQKQIIRLAEIFLAHNEFPLQYTFRFDAVGIVMNKSPEIEHIKNAYVIE